VFLAASSWLPHSTNRAKVRGSTCNTCALSRPVEVSTAANIRQIPSGRMLLCNHLDLEQYAG
jgi:hypothetical protein